MSTPTGWAGAFGLDGENTVSLCLGPTTGVASPALFRDVPLEYVIADGEYDCSSAELEPTLVARPT